MTDLERGAEAVRLTNEEERKSNNEQTCYTKEELEGWFFTTMLFKDFCSENKSRFINQNNLFRTG